MKHLNLSEIHYGNEEKRENPLFFSILENWDRNGLALYSDGYLDILLIRGGKAVIRGDIKNVSSVASFLKDKEWSSIAGSRGNIKAISQNIPGVSEENRHLMLLTRGTFRKTDRNEKLKVLRTERDFIDLFRLYRNIPEMKEGFGKRNDEDNTERFLSSPFPFTAVGLYEDDKLVSGAYLGRVTRKTAFVVGVATEIRYRGRGYAKAVVSELADISLNENMMESLMLWYSSDKAGDIYRALGFEDIEDIVYARRVNNEVRQSPDR